MAGYPVDFRGSDSRLNAMQKLKQEYSQYYRNNVSELRKQSPSPDERKARLQNGGGDTDASNNSGGGFYAKFNDHKRPLNSSQILKQDYAEVLKKQIEERTRLQSSTLAVQRRTNVREDQQYRMNSDLMKDNPYEMSIGRRDGQTRQPDSQQPRLDGGGGGQNVVYRPRKDIQSQRRSPDIHSSSNPAAERKEQETGGGGSGSGSGALRFNVLLTAEQQKSSKPTRQPNINEGDSLMDQMYQRDARESELKRLRQAEYYRGMNNERSFAPPPANRVASTDQRAAAASAAVGFEWKQSDKSLIEQIGDNYYKKIQRKALDTEDFAEQLQLQVHEKKREKAAAKEKQDQLDKMYEEKIKSDLAELKAKYELEMQGKQHEIKTLKKTIEKKKAAAVDHIVKQAEAADAQLSQSPPSPDHRREYDEQNDVSRHSNGGGAAPHQQWKVLRPNVGETVLTHVLPDSGQQHAYNQQMQRSSPQDELERFKEEIAERKRQSRYKYEIMNNWQPPSMAWVGKDAQLEQELTAVKGQLYQQTNLLSMGAQRMKLDVQNASELKNSALNDLESLKESLLKQNQSEQKKLKDLQASLGNFAHVNHDFLPKSINKNQSAALFPMSGFQTLPQANNLSALNFQIQKRLQNTQLNRADIQLLEVDNLLHNLRTGAF